MSFINNNEINNFLNHAYIWLHDNLLDWSLFAQITVSLSIYLISHRISQKPTKILDEYFKNKFSIETLNKYNEEALIKSVLPLVKFRSTMACCNIYHCGHIT